MEAGDRDEDRLATFPLPDGRLIVLADGAGGTGSGGRAAEAVCAAAARAVFDGPRPTDAWVRWLRELDQAIHASRCGGETTAVVVQLHRGELCGASVGDSGAAILDGDALVDLTEHQIRKPLLGSRMARPVGFGPHALRGRLLVASDGLWTYVRRETIVAASAGVDLDAALESLVDAARLRSGKLPDDLAMVLCEGG